MLTGLITLSRSFYRYRHVIYLVFLLTLILTVLILPSTVVLAGDGLGGIVCNGC